MNTLTPTIEHTDLILVTERDGQRAVRGRELHQFLEVETPYAKWFPRMAEYGFTEGQDFQTFLSESTGGRQSTQHALTLDMAKELSMIQRTERGKQARQYIIEIEKRAKVATPAELSRMEILQLAMQAEQENVALKAEVAAALPKITYVDQFVADTDLLKLRAVASRLGVGETALRGLLIAKKWIYRETSSRWSESKQAKVEVTRYSAYAEKKHLFQPVMNHEAPRFKGETMHTLKVTPSGASAIARLIDHAEKFAALTA